VVTALQLIPHHRYPNLNQVLQNPSLSTCFLTTVLSSRDFSEQRRYLFHPIPSFIGFFTELIQEEEEKKKQEEALARLSNSEIFSIVLFKSLTVFTPASENLRIVL